MKMRFFLSALSAARVMNVVCVLALGFSTTVHAQTAAPITHVTLYPGTAMVERTAQISAGMRSLDLDNLPANFDTNTLRVEADSGIRVGQIVIKDAKSRDAVHPHEKALLKKRVGLQDRIAAINSETKAANLVAEYLGRVDNSTTTAKGNVQQIASAIQSSGQEAFLRIQRAEERKRPIEEELSLVTAELEKFRNDNGNSREISIQLASDTAGKLRISYQVLRAGWQPAYRVALDTNQSKLNLERFAQISQKTGEDWTNVKLKLSTGQPLALHTPLDPQTRPLTFRKPEARALNKDTSVMASMAPAPVSAARKDTVQDDYVAPIIETQGNFATEFEVPKRVTLAADGREIAVLLGQQSVAANVYVQVVPSERKIGVLLADFERPEGVWLSGKVQLFRDGSFVGVSQWNSGETNPMSLGFGQDDLLRVTVERKVRHDGTTGFTGQRRLRQSGDTYAISSQHRTPIDIVVLEASPVAQSEEIELQSGFVPEPTGKAWKDRAGIAFWNKTLKPNETFKIDVAYTLSYPKVGSVYCPAGNGSAFADICTSR